MDRTEIKVLRGRMSLMSDDPYWWALPFALLGERISQSDNKNGDVSLGEYDRY